jgi:hypothetical protein
MCLAGHLIRFKVLIINAFKANVARVARKNPIEDEGENA